MSRTAALACMLVLPALGLAGCQAIKAATTVPTTNLATLSDKTPSGTYAIDPDHNAVLFSVRHFHFANTVGRFRDVKGTLQWDLANPEASKLDITINTASLDTNSKAIDDPLKAKGMFDVANFPTAHFVSTAIKRTSPQSASGQITGNLTMKGATHPVTLDVVFNGGAIDGLTNKPVLGFSATGKLDRGNWGMGEWFPVVGSDVTLQIEAEFDKAP